MPSPLLPPGSLPSLWDKRYDIYNETFARLRETLTGIQHNVDPKCIRYILIPIIIMALLSRPNSPEREMCLSYFARHKQYMNENYPRGASDASMDDIASGKSSPQGGEELNIEIPWDKLDEFSARAEADRRDSGVHYHIDGVTEGAPEWNWFDMLNHLQMTMICKWPFFTR